MQRSDSLATRPKNETFNYVVYILQCHDESFYTGITNDLPHRLKMHGKGLASKYTRARLPVKLVYKEENYSHSQALQRELQIKKLTHQQKKKLIIS